MSDVWLSLAREMYELKGGRRRNLDASGRKRQNWKSPILPKFPSVSIAEEIDTISIHFLAFDN